VAEELARPAIETDDATYALEDGEILFFLSPSLIRQRLLAQDEDDSRQSSPR
jgi:hypothetical protein